MESIKYKKIKNCSVIDPKVSIIIRCKNEGKNIEECLNMLYKQKIGLKKEIIVIDSGSNDNTVELTIKHDVSIYLINSKDFNFGTSINLGIMLARGEFCVFLSAHAIPKNDVWLWELVNPLLTNDNLAATYSKQVYRDDSFIMEKISLYYTFGDVPRIQKNNKTTLQTYKKIKKEINFSNASSCIRKSAAIKFPFSKILASEDREWAKKVLCAGYEIFYNPKSEIYHAHNENIDQWYHRIYINSKALYQFAGVKINIFHIMPLFLLRLYRDLKFCHLKHIKLNYGTLKIFITYEYYYVLAHYKSTRE